MSGQVENGIQPRGVLNVAGTIVRGCWVTPVGLGEASPVRSPSDKVRRPANQLPKRRTSASAYHFGVRVCVLIVLVTHLLGPQRHCHQHALDRLRRPEAPSHSGAKTLMTQERLPRWTGSPRHRVLRPRGIGFDIHAGFCGHPIGRPLSWGIGSDSGARYQNQLSPCSARARRLAPHQPVAPVQLLPRRLVVLALEPTGRG